MAPGVTIPRRHGIHGCHGHPVEQRDFRGLGKQGVPDLLGIAINVPGVVRINPTAAVAAVRTDVAVVAVDLVALVLLQQLVGYLRVARLGARVDEIKRLGLLVEVKPQGLEVFVPVRVLDGDFDARVGGAGGFEYQVLGDFAHLLEAVLGPAAIALGGNVRIALAVIEEKVIENHFVEVPCRKLDGALAFSAVLRIFVVEGRELATAFVLGKGDAAGCRNALGLEKLFNPLERGFVGKHAAAKGFDVDLVEAELAGHAAVLLVADLGIGHFAGGVNGHINGCFEALIGVGG